MSVTSLVRADPRVGPGGRAGPPLRLLRRYVRRQLAPRRPVSAVAEQVIGLHEFVDFARAFVDDRALAVPVEAAHGVLVGVTVGPVDLNRISRGALRRDG